MPSAIKIGVSACLLGERIRPDSSHARSHYITETLAKYVEFVPLCPEMACGMGLPREEVRQVDCAGEIRLIGYESGEDWTERMDAWCSRMLPDLESEQLSGFILQNRSPTCALKHGRIHSTEGRTARRGQGFFAQRLATRYPLLPLESDDGLKNPITRENFIRRIFAMYRWQETLERGAQIGHLVDFHTRHKMLIRAHDLRCYRELGRLLGESTMANTQTTLEAYAELLFKALSYKSTRKKNGDVLMHATGYFKKNLESDDKQEIQSAINAYKSGKLPLIVPVTLINHHARKQDKAYLRQQVYFHPHPYELKLLNHS